MILYIFISYLVMLGMMIESYRKHDHIPTEAWFMLAFSPLVFPIIIGMDIVNKNSK